VVTSPNYQHVPYANAAMSRSLPVMLEKPVATTVDDMATLWDAYENRPGGQVVVGFVLRYTPFYSRIREIIESGRLGESLSIQTDETLGTGLTMVQYRGWRQARHSRVAGCSRSVAMTWTSSAISWAAGPRGCSPWPPRCTSVRAPSPSSWSASSPQ